MEAKVTSAVPALALPEAEAEEQLHPLAEKFEVGDGFRRAGKSETEGIVIAVRGKGNEHLLEGGAQIAVLQGDGTVRQRYGTLDALDLYVKEQVVLTSNPA